jgi:uncharacterized protein with GYD domain
LLSDLLPFPLSRFSPPTMLYGLFNIASAGNVRSETLRAFTETEMEGVIQKM